MWMEDRHYVSRVRDQLTMTAAFRYSPRAPFRQISVYNEKRWFPLDGVWREETFLELSRIRSLIYEGK